MESVGLNVSTIHRWFVHVIRMLAMSMITLWKRKKCRTKRQKQSNV